MSLRLSMAVTAVLLIVAGVAAFLFVTTEPGRRELEKLQGTWVRVGYEEKGDVLTPEEAKRGEWLLVVKGDKLSLFRHGKLEERWTVRLNPSKQPAAMDLIYPAGGINHAIYSLEGDRLTICWSRKLNPNRPEERPTKLTTKEGENGDLSGMVLGIFERQK